MRSVSVSALLATLGACAAFADARQDILSRMDQAAAGFHAMSAQIRHTTHTAVLNDDDTETGTVIMRKVAPGEIQGVVEFQTPDHKFYAFEKRKLQIYTPNNNTVQVYDLGKHGEQLDQFLSIGFGTSGKDLERAYRVTVGGKSTIGGQPVTKLELVPITPDAKQYLTHIELWLSDDNYPVREKLYEPSGDYVLVDYSGVKINPPLAADAMKLKVAAGAKYEYPQK